MACSLPPSDSDSNAFPDANGPDDEMLLRLLSYEGCNVTIDDETRTCLMMLSREVDLLNGSPLPAIFFDEKGLTRLILQLRIMLARLRELPVPPPVTTDTIITLYPFPSSTSSSPFQQDADEKKKNKETPGGENPFPYFEL